MQGRPEGRPADGHVDAARDRRDLARTGQPRSLRMASVDRVVHGTQISILVGPVDLPSRDELADAFARVAALGPRWRLGLTFGPGGRWLWHGARTAARLHEIVREAPVPGPQVRQWLATHTIPDLPVQMAVADGYLAIVTDHSLFDGHFGLTLPALLIDVARGGPVPPHAVRLTGHPLVRAVWHTWGLDPRRWRALVRTVRAQRGGQGAPAGAPVTGLTPQDVDLRVSQGRGTVRNVHVTMDPRRFSEFRAWSRGRIGFSASLLLLAAAAARAAGLEVTSRGDLVVSARRYLPDGVATYGNFITATSLPVTGPDSRPEAVAARLQESLATGKPLAALTMAVARSTIARLRDRARRHRAPGGGPVAAVTDAPPAPSAPPAPRTVRLSVSDDGVLRSVAGLPWLAPRGERVVEVVGDAIAPGAIGMITCVVDGRLHLVMSFRHDGFALETVERFAALLATRPVECLTAAGYPAAQPTEAT